MVYEHFDAKSYIGKVVIADSEGLIRQPASRVRINLIGADCHEGDRSNAHA